MVDFLGMRKGRKNTPTTCNSSIRSHGTFKIIMAKVVRMFLLLNDSSRRGRCRGHEWGVRIMCFHLTHLCRGRVVFVSSLILLGCHGWWGTGAQGVAKHGGHRIKFKRKLIRDLVRRESDFRRRYRSFGHRTSRILCQIYARFHFGASYMSERGISTVQDLYRT